MAVDKYPLIAQLLRCPMDLTLKQQKVTLTLPPHPTTPKLKTQITRTFALTRTPN